MSRHIMMAAVCAGLLDFALSPLLGADPPFRYPERRHGKAELKYVNGIPVLTVEGTPEEIGTGAGVLALQPGRRMADYPKDLLGEFGLSQLHWPLLLAGRQMMQQFPPDYRTELEAMYASAGLDSDRAVLGNTFYDLKKTVLCSALLISSERSTTGGPLLGRNLDYPPLGYAQEYSVVTVYHPRGARHAFASVGFPGAVGCLSGMNDAGLTVAVLEVYQVKHGEKQFDMSGTPFALCYRRVLEECSTIEEARELLKTMKETGLNNLVVADREKVAVMEITPDRVVVRRPLDGICVCTNHFCTKTLRPPVTINMFETLDHFAALEKVSNRGRKLTLDDLRVGLHDACDPDMTLQTMIFEPRTLQLHLSIGTVPASAGEMKVVDLGPLLHTP